MKKKNNKTPFAVRNSSPSSDQNFVYLQISTDQEHPLPSSTSFNAYYFDDLPIMNIQKGTWVKKATENKIESKFSVPIPHFLLSLFLPLRDQINRLDLKRLSIFSQRGPDE